MLHLSILFLGIFACPAMPGTWASLSSSSSGDSIASARDAESASTGSGLLHGFLPYSKFGLPKFVSVVRGNPSLQSDTVPVASLPGSIEPKNDSPSSSEPEVIHHATPFTWKDTSPVPLNAICLDSVNDCGDSTFENHTSGGSPLVSDCVQLVRNIQGGGTWVFESGGTQFQLAQCRTCAFGVQTSCLELQCPKGGILVKVGNQDIMDVITASIAKFSTSDGKVGSQGDMFCQQVGSGYDLPVTWGLYHSH